MTNRGPENICLICKERHSDKTGSHLMPNFLLKYIIGDRGYEAAWFIDTHVPKIANFFGSANILNKETIKKKNKHVKDFIFCTRCEKWLGKIEDYTSEILNTKIRGDRFKQQYKIENFAPSLILKKYTGKINPGIVHLCLFSVAFRCILEYRLRTGGDPIHPLNAERIRVFLAKLVDFSIDELKSETITPPFPYSILSNEEIKFGDPLYGYTYCKPTNPEVFLLGRYILLIQLDQHDSDDLLILPEITYSNDFLNSTASDLNVAFIERTLWDKFNSNYVDEAAKIFNQNLVIDLANSKGIPQIIAKELLRKKTQEVIALNPKIVFTDALLKAFEMLVQGP